MKKLRNRRVNCDLARKTEKDGVGCNLHIQTIQCPVTLASIHAFIAQRGAGQGLAICWWMEIAREAQGAFGWVFQPVSGVVDFNLDGVMFPGFFEGYTKWNMVDPAPHLKFKKLLRDIPFFLKWSQPKQAIRHFSAEKNKTSYKRKLKQPVRASGWWFGGSVVEPISRNYFYHFMFCQETIYTCYHILSIEKIWGISWQKAKRPRSNQQHTALAHKLLIRKPFMLRWPENLRLWLGKSELLEGASKTRHGRFFFFRGC